MIGLSFEAKSNMARALLRNAIREQLQRSLSEVHYRERETIAEEIVINLTRPALAPALQILSAAHVPVNGD